MLELPDVERFKQYVDATSLHQSVAVVHVFDDRILDDVTPQNLRRLLKDRKFTKTHRHGKFLLLRAEGSGWVTLHFGMTGDVAYHDREDDPKYARVNWQFKNGHTLSYTCKRMLGRVGVTETIEDLIDSKELGLDALSKDLTAERFLERFDSVSGAVKPALMKQERIAGIGNVWADEILFQGGVSPKASVSALGRDRLRHVHRVMRRVLRTGVRHHGKPEDLPASYLLRNRAKGADCPRCGGSVRKETVSGRSTYWCPCCQKE